MGFRYDMRNKSGQQQAIVRARDEQDEELRKAKNTNENGQSNVRLIKINNEIITLVKHDLYIVDYEDKYELNLDILFEHEEQYIRLQLDDNYLVDVLMSDGTSFKIEMSQHPLISENVLFFGCELTNIDAFKNIELISEERLSKRKSIEKK